MRSIFRQEAIDYRANRLQGEINLAQPLSWQLISYFLAGILVISVAVLATSTYSKNETVTGVIVPTSGLVRIVSSRPGKVSELFVTEGSRVKTGQPVARISVTESLNDGSKVSERISTSIFRQDKNLSNQSAESERLRISEEKRILEQINGFKNEINLLDRQLSIQDNLVQLAVDDLSRAKEIAVRGFISQREIAQREETLLVRRQTLQQIMQTRALKISGMAEANRNIERNRAQSASTIAGLGAVRARLEQDLVSAEGEEGYTLTAPASGSTTAIAARVGQQVSANSPVLAIVPSGSKLRAELQVDSRAIGFIAPNQEVRLMVDSFPFQQFGSIGGRVVSVPSAPTLLPSDREGANFVYIVPVDLDSQGIVAFGQWRSLLSGMSITARVTTRKQSLLEWLFQPLFAIQRR